MSTRHGVLAGRHILGTTWGRSHGEAAGDSVGPSLGAAATRLAVRCSGFQNFLSSVRLLSPQVFCLESTVEGRLAKNVWAPRSFSSEVSHG